MNPIVVVLFFCLKCNCGHALKDVAVRVTVRTKGGKELPLTFNTSEDGCVRHQYVWRSVDDMVKTIGVRDTELSIESFSFEFAACGNRHVFSKNSQPPAQVTRFDSPEGLYDAYEASRIRFGGKGPVDTTAARKALALPDFAGEQPKIYFLSFGTAFPIQCHASCDGAREEDHAGSVPLLTPEGQQAAEVTWDVKDIAHIGTQFEYTYHIKAKWEYGIGASKYPVTDVEFCFDGATREKLEQVEVTPPSEKWEVQKGERCIRCVVQKDADGIPFDQIGKFKLKMPKGCKQGQVKFRPSILESGKTAHTWLTEPTGIPGPMFVSRPEVPLSGTVVISGDLPRTLVADLLERLDAEEFVTHVLDDRRGMVTILSRAERLPTDEDFREVVDPRPHEHDAPHEQRPDPHDHDHPDAHGGVRGHGPHEQFPHQHVRGVSDEG